MQLIREVAEGVEEYLRTDGAKAVAAPLYCPSCEATRQLVALGYYGRNVTSGRRVLRILVRRFRCLLCGKTVSILPSFAQPYRLVENRTIDSFFKGELNATELIWAPLLGCYRVAFVKWLPEVSRWCGALLPRSPPLSAAEQWWALLGDIFGQLASSTRAFVEKFGITLFGRYRCHRPNPAVHTPL